MRGEDIKVGDTFFEDCSPEVYLAIRRANSGGIIAIQIGWFNDNDTDFDQEEEHEFVGSGQFHQPLYLA